MDFSEADVAYDIKADLFFIYQRSRSFTDLGPRSLSFNRFKVFSKTAELIETKLHIEHLFGWEINVCSLNLGRHAHKNYGKKDLKFFISGTE